MSVEKQTFQVQLWDPEEADRCEHNFVESGLKCIEKETGLERQMQCCVHCGMLVKFIPEGKLSEYDEIV